MNEDRRARINRLKWHCRRALLELDLAAAPLQALDGQLAVGDRPTQQDLDVDLVV